MTLGELFSMAVMILVVWLLVMAFGLAVFPS